MKAVIVEASALAILLANPYMKSTFIKITKTCEAVICCRVSPGQKAAVVRMIKEDDPEVITLSIGDGANDVSMMREAHIGVGLYGNEGMRAVQSSDFALGEFKFLWRLILHHGRLSYMRNSETILYFFYKNLVMTAPHFFFAFMNGYSGQTIFDDYYISFYNLFYTSWPLVIKACMEQDVSYALDGKDIRMLYPKLYYIGAYKTIFNWKNYTKSNIKGLIHSIIIFMVPVLVYQEHGIMGAEGKNVDIWAVSMSSFTCLYAVVTITLCVWTRWWTKISWFFYIVMSVFVYIAYVWFSNYWDGSKVVHSIIEVHMSPLFWFTILLISMATYVSELGMEYWRFENRKNSSDYVRGLVHHLQSIGYKEPIKELGVDEDEML